MMIETRIGAFLELAGVSRGGFPDGALPALGTARFEVVIFVGALIAGTVVATAMQAVLARRGWATA